MWTSRGLCKPKPSARSRNHAKLDHMQNPRARQRRCGRCPASFLLRNISRRSRKTAAPGPATLFPPTSAIKRPVGSCSAAVRLRQAADTDAAGDVISGTFSALRRIWEGNREKRSPFPSGWATARSLSAIAPSATTPRVRSTTREAALRQVQSQGGALRLPGRGTARSPAHTMLRLLPPGDPAPARARRAAGSCPQREATGTADFSDARSDRPPPPACPDCGAPCSRALSSL